MHHKEEEKVKIIKRVKVFKYTPQTYVVVTIGNLRFDNDLSHKPNER